MHRVTLLSVLIPVVVLVGACAPAPQAAPSQVPAPPAEAVVTSAVVVSVDGDVASRTDGDWADLEVGDVVGQTAQVRTGASGACDLQFGTFGVVHLSEKSVLSLKTIELKDSRRTVNLELIGGTVSAKVGKLVGVDQFGVRTDVVQAGVRGTRFVVTKRAGRTFVAVAEGAVALVPPHFEVPAVLSERIFEVSPQVSVGSEVEVTPASMEGPTKALEAVTKALDGWDGTTVPSAVDQSLATYQLAAKAPGGPLVQPVSAATQTLLNQTANLEVKPTLPEPRSSEPRVPEPKAPQGLKAPVSLSPTKGQAIDILKQESLAFRWQAVEGATGYSVTLWSVQGAKTTAIKSWQTTETQVVLEKFDNLKVGAFAWDVVAQRDGVPPETKATRTPFVITKGGQLSAPTLDLSEEGTN